MSGLASLNDRHRHHASYRDTVLKITESKNTMGIIGTILIGFVAGLVARAIKPGNDSMGFFLTAVIGIAGSLIATYLGQFLRLYRVGEASGFIASVIGAIVLLVIWGMVSKKR